jgi:hypothetical protein
MPFVLYQTYPLHEVKPVREVELAGERGPFASYVQSQAVKSFASFEWRLSEAGVLKLLGVENVANHALVFESKPNRVNGASRGRVREIWGFTNTDWTSVLMRIEVWSTEKTEDPGQGSLDFVSEPNSGTVYQLLHLNGGTLEQKWSWAANTGLNGPLLPSDALQFFMRSVAGNVSAPLAAKPEPPEVQAPEKSSRRRSDAEIRMYEEMRRDLEQLFGPGRTQTGPSDGEARLTEEMRRDLETLLGPKRAEPEPQFKPSAPSASEPAERNNRTIQRAFFEWAKSR